MACSLASHITAIEAGLPVKVRYVDTATKKTDDGGDYYEIAPNGYVPALRLPSGEILNEGVAVLQWLADQRPEAGLAPRWGTPERYRLIDTLNYLSTEVHKRVFHPIFTRSAPEASKEAARALLEPTLDYISRHLGSRQYLVGDTFTVADAYLITLLNWYRFLGIDLARWPNIDSYGQRLWARPAVAEAMSKEVAERKRRAA
jgi:glutathione S-transferase